MASEATPAALTTTPATVDEAVRITSQFPDIHQFDHAILQVVPSYPTRSDDEVRSLIQTLTTCGLSEPALAALQVVLKDVGQSANQLGKLRADALLAEIASRPDLQSDYASDLSRQLEDMHSGFCPSGRVTRIYQVYQAFIERADLLVQTTSRNETAERDEENDAMSCKVGQLSLHD